MPDIKTVCAKQKVLTTLEIRVEIDGAGLWVAYTFAVAAGETVTYRFSRR